ncbi:MAG: hypothetical protein WD069_02565 [Planctomycetales bacterium]
MTRHHGLALAVCLCLSLAAGPAARGQHDDFGAWTTSAQPVDAMPVHVDGDIESSEAIPSESRLRTQRAQSLSPDPQSQLDHTPLPVQRHFGSADGPVSTPRPTAFYTEHHESPEDIIRSARAAAGSGDAAFAPFDDPPVESDRAFGDDSEWGVFDDPPRTASRPDYLDTPRPTPVERPYLDPDQLLLPDTPPRPQAPVYVEPWIEPDHARLFTTWLPGSGNDLGLTEIDVEASLVFPKAKGLWIAPGFGTVFTDGPVRTDLPPRLYNARLEVGYKHDFAPHVGVSVSIAPGVYSDFEQGSSDAFRILGKGIGFFAFSEQTQAILGIAYLDREDVRVLPVFGIIHLPDENWRLEFTFPQPRFAYRILQGDASSAWLYLGGEFGGNTWAIARDPVRRRGPAPAAGFPPPGSRDDVVTYSDWRLKFGFEWKADSGRNVIVETGYVFNRELEYKSDRGNYDPSSTALFRFGFTY